MDGHAVTRALATHSDQEISGLVPAKYLRQMNTVLWGPRILELHAAKVRCGNRAHALRVRACA